MEAIVAKSRKLTMHENFYLSITSNGCKSTRKKKGGLGDCESHYLKGNLKQSKTHQKQQNGSKG